MRDLKQITVIGLGLLGGSITLALSRAFPRVKVVGYSHRASTREKARRLSIAAEISDSIKSSVSQADVVVLAAPVSAFENIFTLISGSLPAGCIVTDVGSTKVLPHRWAAKCLPGTVRYVGSHPIAGSEQRGIEFARDDLFDGTVCILTTTKATDRHAFLTLEKIWSGLGCTVYSMSPVKHDKVFANVSHLPHILAVSLVNATGSEDLKFAGKGFIDTSRIASSPADIWADVLMTNTNNIIRGIDRIAAELNKIKKAIAADDRRIIVRLLNRAKQKRLALINYKMKRSELV